MPVIRAVALLLSPRKSATWRSAVHAAKEIKGLISNSHRSRTRRSRRHRRQDDGGDRPVGEARYRHHAEISGAVPSSAAASSRSTQRSSQMDKVTQQNAALVEEAASAAKSMEDQPRT